MTTFFQYITVNKVRMVLRLKDVALIGLKCS